MDSGDERRKFQRRGQVPAGEMAETHGASLARDSGPLRGR